MRLSPQRHFRVLRLPPLLRVALQSPKGDPCADLRTTIWGKKEKGESFFTYSEGAGEYSLARIRGICACVQSMPVCPMLEIQKESKRLC